MTKAEMEIELKNAQNKLNEQRHLADVVEVKDKEIARIKEDSQKEIARIKEDCRRKEDERSSDANNVIKNATKPLEHENEKIRKELDRRINELNRLIRVHGNLLKSIQGSLDNAIELNEYIIKEVQDNGN